MNDLDFSELDKYTQKMLKRLETEYPNEAMKFLTKHINLCKGEAQYRTPKGETGKLKKGWRVKVTKKKGKIFATIKNSQPHAHLIENGHMTKDGGWWEGKHMLENTMTNRQPFIDRDIDKLINQIFDSI